MTVTAKIILDSISPEGIRLPTIHARYPRMIHSELMTHRVFSRNGRSSRAVPVMTLLKEEPYIPHFMKNKPGMSASEEMDESDRKEAEAIWLELVNYTKSIVKHLHDLGVHKQWANRPLEWFGYIDVLITSTDWANFMALRDETGAQPEIDQLANAIKKVLNESTPKLLKPGEWHMPYIGPDDWEDTEEYLASIGQGNEYGVAKFSDIVELLKKISTARCARLSYAPFDGNGSIEKELDRFEKLMVSRPVHASPAEHIATPDICYDYGSDGKAWQKKYEWGNFYGWRQFRKMIPDNTIYDR